jgi:hypothetical protein
MSFKYSEKRKLSSISKVVRWFCRSPYSSYFDTKFNCEILSYDKFRVQSKFATAAAMRFLNKVLARRLHKMQ